MLDAAIRYYWERACDGSIPLYQAAVIALSALAIGLAAALYLSRSTRK